MIHAATPVYYDGKSSEEKLLASCYEKSLYLAERYNCESIAFPLLGAGNNGFKNDVALDIAVNEIRKFLTDHEMMVYLVVYDKNSFSLSEKLFSSVKSYIDENYISQNSCSDEWFFENASSRTGRLSQKHRYAASERKESVPCEECGEIGSPQAVKGSRSLDDLLSELEETFSQTLIRHIDRKGLKDPDVYKKANVDRKLFNKIKNNTDYNPSKKTAIAFAIALELNLDETKDLLGRAGYALSRSSKSDVIIEYFITNKNYNIFEINEVLFAFDQNLIGA